MPMRLVTVLLTLWLAACTAPPTWFVFLETGKPTPPDRERVMAMRRGHLSGPVTEILWAQWLGKGVLR